MHRSNMRGIICAKTGLGKAHYIDSFAGMMSSLRKIAGKTNIPSSPRDKSALTAKIMDCFCTIALKDIEHSTASAQQ